MRRLERGKQTVTVKRPRPAVPGNAFEASGHALRATVYPMSGQTAAQLYGLRVSEMRQLLCDFDADIREGDGVCVGVAADADPDYRVTYVAPWTGHAVAHIRFIPANERGGDE